MKRRNTKNELRRELVRRVAKLMGRRYRIVEDAVSGFLYVTYSSLEHGGLGESLCRWKNASELLLGSSVQSSIFYYFRYSYGLKDRTRRLFAELEGCKSLEEIAVKMDLEGV